MYHSVIPWTSDITFSILSSPCPNLCKHQNPFTSLSSWVSDHDIIMHLQMKTKHICLLLIKKQWFQTQLDGWPSHFFIHTCKMQIKCLGRAQMLPHWKIYKINIVLKPKHFNYPVLSHLKINTVCVGRHLQIGSVRTEKNHTAYCLSFIFLFCWDPSYFFSLYLHSSTFKEIKGFKT